MPRSCLASQQSQDGASAHQALAAPVLLSCILARFPLPLSLFKGLIFVTLCFLTACPVLWECRTQREVFHGREGSLPSFVEGLETRLSQEMEGGQDIPRRSLERSGIIFINNCPALDLRAAFNLTAVSKH